MWEGGGGAQRGRQRWRGEKDSTRLGGRAAPGAVRPGGKWERESESGRDTARCRRRALALTLNLSLSLSSIPQPIVHVAFIPAILALGMAYTEPRPTLVQLLAPM